MPNSYYSFVLAHTWGKTERKSKQGKPLVEFFYTILGAYFSCMEQCGWEDLKNQRLTKLFERYVQCWSPDYTNKLKRWFDSCQLVLLLCSLTVTFLYYEHLCIWKINPSCKKDCEKNCSYYTPVYIADVK